MSGRVARCRDGFDRRVAQLDHLAIAQGVVIEHDAGVLGQVAGCAGARDKLGQAGDVVGLDVGVEHRGDRRALPLGERDVLVHQVEMGVDDREGAVGLAAEEVRGAGGVVVEELAEVHALDNVSIDLLNSNAEMAATGNKNALFEAIAVMGKAFASPRRLELLDLLAQAPRTVDELARASGQSTANTSQHLQALHAAGMVTRTREGTSVRYAIAGDEALALWLAIRNASASQLGEVERAARDYLGADVETISRQELVERLGHGDVVLVDVRPTAEFEAGHIDGALSIPIDELARRLAELPTDHEVVAYCRGPFCAYAHDAVRQLHAA